MDDYALVLNAGSSSLKFCVYRRSEGENWRLEARGQIEGIGTSPRLSAKDAEGASLADQTLDATVRDGRAALDALAGWLRSRYGGSRVLGVGHRVVHGGARHARPTVVTRQVLEELRQLIPLAPLHQPHNLAAIEAVFERLPDVPQVACFDTSLSSWATGCCRAGAAATRSLPIRAAALWFSWTVLRIHCFCFAASCAGDCSGTGDRRPSGKWRQFMRPQGREKRR